MVLVGPYHFRPEWWVNLLSFKLFPVDLPKQRVLADVSPHSQPLFRFPHKELSKSRKGAVTSQGTSRSASDEVAFLNLEPKEFDSTKLKAQ